MNRYKGLVLKEKIARYRQIFPRQKILSRELGMIANAECLGLIFVHKLHYSCQQGYPQALSCDARSTITGSHACDLENVILKY